MTKIISGLYHNKFSAHIFHTLGYLPCQKLKDCKTVLDLGCGLSSPLQHCPWIKYSVGIEAFKLYLEKSKRAGIHTEYLNKKIEELDFQNNLFNAVIMIDVLEHLPKEIAFKILKKAQKWARKKVLISTPNGFVQQPEVDKNSLQKYRSGLSYQEMRKSSLRCYGLAWLKILRCGKDKNLTNCIIFKPKSSWFPIVTFNQIFIYYFSNFDLELFCIKTINYSNTRSIYNL